MPANLGPGSHLSLIVAMTPARVIGRDNGLPWHLPEDLKRFKALTLGKPIVMGRRTYESIGRPLPGRRNIVLSRRADFAPPGVEVVRSLDAALAAAGDAAEIMIIGGAELYASALPLATRLYVTEVHGDVDGDVRFPPIDPRDWREVEARSLPADARHAHAMTFRTLQRR